MNETISSTQESMTTKLATVLRERARVPVARVAAQVLGENPNFSPVLNGNVAVEGEPAGTPIFPPNTEVVAVSRPFGETAAQETRPPSALFAMVAANANPENEPNCLIIQVERSKNTPGAGASMKELRDSRLTRVVGMVKQSAANGDFVSYLANTSADGAVSFSVVAPEQTPFDLGQLYDAMAEPTDFQTPTVPDFHRPNTDPHLLYEQTHPGP